MHALASKAYGSAHQRTASDREIEYALFLQITDALEAAENSGSTVERADALHRNQSLWSILSVDLLHPDNKLPIETRRGLISLAEFVRRYSLKASTEGWNLSPLIDVNKTVMAGLNPSGR